MGSRTAISVGVLAVALVAVPVGAPAASAAAQDCTRDGGLLGGVTNTLCDVVGTLTGTVDTLSGGVTEPVTKGVDGTTDELLGRVGEAVPTTRSTTDRPAGSTPSATPSDPEPAKTMVTPEATGDACSSARPCTNQENADRLSPGHTPEPTRTRRSPKDRDQAATTVTGSPTFSASARPHTTPHESRPHPVDRERPAEKKTVRAEEPRVDLLWPNPFAHELAVPMQDQRVVRPTPPASDVLGTALTIALLGSAVLATRIVQQRRQRTEPTESIPFEPAHAGNGRQRLA